MKFKKIILSAALSLGVAALANASTTYVYLTGSTAMQGPVITTLTNSVFNSGNTLTVWGDGTNKTIFVAVHGTTAVGGLDVTVQSSWSGSEAGIADVASNTVVQELFMDPSQMNGLNNGATAPASFTTNFVQLAMADNAQQYSRTLKPILANNAEVGVVTFAWVRNGGLWTGSNVTDQQLRQALIGNCKLALFSGNAGDTNSRVYVSGRDNSSGTRVNTFGDCGFGILTPPSQVEMDTNGNLQVSPGDSDYEDDWGFPTTGSLVASLAASTTSISDPTGFNQHGTKGYSVIAYLGISGAKSATNGTSCAILSYNGVPFAPTNVIEGTYPFWGNEYIFEANSGVSSQANAIYAALTNDIPGNVDGVTAIALSNMHCKRAGGPTGDVTHN